MQTSKLLNRIHQNTALKKYEKHKKIINKLVNTSQLNINSDAYKEIELAKETIANFAKKNGVSIDFFEPKEHQTNKKNIILKVSNMLNGKNKECAISPDTTLNITISNNNLRVLRNRETGTEYIAIGQITTEDTFLRNIYRNISNLTKAVKNKK